MIHLLASLGLGLSAPAHAKGPGDAIGICGYHAALFSASDYADDRVGDLDTPNTDIERIAEVLRDKYGFEAKTYPDATRSQILDTLDQLGSSLRDCDALIVYYAGHGELDQEMGEGFWLPVDAKRDSKSDWVANGAIKQRLKAMKAKHVLLISDSCFSGSLFRALDVLPQEPVSGDVRRASTIARDRSRWVLSSGGEELVADQYRNSGMSVFAYFLRQQLTNATGQFVLVDDWFPSLRVGVMDNANQRPHSGRMTGAGHEGGLFVFANQQWDGKAAPAPRPAPEVMAAAQVVPTRPEPAKGYADFLVKVPGGTFRMGSPGGEPHRGADEGPVHQVTVKPLLVMKSEVSQDLYQEVMGSNPAKGQQSIPGKTLPAAMRSCAAFKGTATDVTLVDERYPAVCVSWLDAVKFANAMSRREKLTPAYEIAGSDVKWSRSANGYRLLTEAEWEWAARGGNAAALFAGASDFKALCKYANTYNGDEGRQCSDIHPGLSEVGAYAANGFGLVDMTGNASEWVWDRYGKYRSGSAVDPAGPSTGNYRVTRGGAWLSPAKNARIAKRNPLPPGTRLTGVGFRLARSAE